MSPSPCILPERPAVSAAFLDRVERDYERFARDGLPGDIEDYLLQEYQLDVAADYGGLPLRNPWGKASGQLSMTAHQVEEDIAAGVGFVVLKTVIAQDAAGSQSMRAWAIPESRMLAERITGKSGETGWTISWKGRGWWQSFEEYLQLVRDARRIARAKPQAVIVPSCKFHLPNPGEAEWRVAEYEYTVARLLEAYFDDRAKPQAEVMPLEKDFSPTLAGSDRAAAREKILEWLREVPRLVKAAARKATSGEAGANGERGPVHLGLKLFNALFDDEFQLEMLRAIHAAPVESRPEFVIYGNRLFDPERTFEGHRGIAYGGPDLSDRNLHVLSRFQREEIAGGRLPLSATGNITTGRMALEYALRGASSFQLHTFFQLPAGQYAMKAGTKTQKALHELYFHPQTGFVVWMRHLADALKLAGEPVRFVDVVGQGTSNVDFLVDGEGNAKRGSW